MSGAAPRYVLISALDVVPEAELLARVERAPTGTVVLVRDKSLPLARREALARAVLDVARPRGLAVWMSETAALAAKLGLDGVHLGGAPSADRVREARAHGLAIVSVACHAVADVRALTAFPVDSRPSTLFLSPIFESPGKGAPLGVGALAEARAALEQVDEASRPWLVALGGVDHVRAAACFAAGADGVAAILRPPFG